MVLPQALLGNPKLLIFDEPTAGLDPSERIRFRNLIEKLSKDHSIILSTHIISDIESSCKDAAVIHHGEVLFQGLTDALVDVPSILFQLEKTSNPNTATNIKMYPIE